MHRNLVVLALFTSLLAGPAMAREDAAKGRKVGKAFAPLGLEGATLSETLDYVGRIHNEYQEVVLSQLAAERVDIQNEAARQSAFATKTAAFFREKGIDVAPYYVAPDFNPPAGEISFPLDQYSPEAAQILTKLKHVLEAAQSDEVSDATIRADLEALKASALQLAGETEAVAVGVPVSVALYSFDYWQANASRWIDTFTRTSDRQLSKGRCRIKWRSVGTQDVVGAVQGATMGSFVGPVGGLTGGAIQGSTASAANLLVQGIGCLFNLF